MIPTPLIEIKDLCYTYQGQEVLHGVDFSLHDGDFTAVIGPNGGGKTTLLKLIIGILTPTRGEIFIHGTKRCKSTNIGYVPQYINHNLQFPATALDVVLMGNHCASKRFRLFSSKADRAKAYAALERIGIADYADRKIQNLSGGQRQRVLIARALIAEPELLVLDEPTASIDTRGQSEFYSLLTELNKDLSILLVSHDLLMVSTHAKSLACLNKSLTYHPSFSSFSQVLDKFYDCSYDKASSGIQQQINAQEAAANG